MALYDYYCPQCDMKFVMNKAMEHREYARCPHCNSISKIVPSVFNLKVKW